MSDILTSTGRASFDALGTAAARGTDADAHPRAATVEPKEVPDNDSNRL